MDILSISFLTVLEEKESMDNTMQCVQIFNEAANFQVAIGQNNVIG
jgi:hypothetical protein